MIEGYLVGVIATASVTAGFFFLKFWRATRDPFFLDFAASFILEGLNRSAAVLIEHPNEGPAWTYWIRLLSLLLILGAILRKNYGSR
jgi:hypothetical protein